jgi:hypothetical protein
VQAIPVLAHTFNGSYTTTKEPTCTKEGEKVGKCTKCQTVVTTGVIPVDKNKHRNIRWLKTKEATISTSGEKQGICNECGADVTEIIPSQASKFKTSTSKAFVGVHEVTFEPLSSGFYHTSIIIFVGKDSKYYNDERFGIWCEDDEWRKALETLEIKYMTIGAGQNAALGPFNVLKSGLNREKDVKLDNKVQFIPINSNGSFDDGQIGKLLTMREVFENNGRLEYNSFPENPIGEDADGDYYNSNSFTKGLLNAAGYSSIERPDYKVPGWDKLVSTNMFTSP